MICDCDEFKRLSEIEHGVWVFASVHFYPKDGPQWQFCPMCGKKLVDKIEEKIVPLEPKDYPDVTQGLSYVHVIDDDIIQR